MLHGGVGWLSAHDVENFNHLWSRWIDDCEDISTEGDVSLVQELNTKALALWRRDKLAFVGVDVEVLACVDQSEVLGSLDDEEDNILDVENEWRAPVHGAVDIALRGGANDEVVVLHAHVDDSLSEVKIIVHLVEAVIDADSVFGIENSFDMSPLECSVNDMTKDNLSVSTSS